MKWTCEVGPIWNHNRKPERVSDMRCDESHRKYLRLDGLEVGGIGGGYAIAMGKELAMRWSEGKCDVIDRIANVCDDRLGGLT